MTPGAGIGGLRKALGRLEAMAGRRAPCAYCRLWYAQCIPVNPAKPIAWGKDVAEIRCEFCLNEYGLLLGRFPERDRDFYRLIYSFTTEDEFVDRRAHAAHLWLLNRPRRWADGSAPGQRLGRGKVKRDTGVRRLNALLEEAREMCRRRHERFAARYGRDSFPDLRQLCEAVRTRAHESRDRGLYVPALLDLWSEEDDHLVRAELEKVIVGRVLLSTEETLVRLRARIAEAMRKERRMRARKEEEQRRREDEAREAQKRRAQPARPAGIPHDTGVAAARAEEDNGGFPWASEEMKKQARAVIVKAAPPSR